MSADHSTDKKTLQKRLRAAQERIARLEEELRAVAGTVPPFVDSPQSNWNTFEKMRRELRRSKNRYRKYFNYASDAMFVIIPDQEKGVYSTYIDVNKEAIRRLGYTRKEFLGMCPLDITPPENRLFLHEKFVELLQTGTVIYESVHVCRNGARIPVELNTLLLEVDGELLILAGARDISERKQAEIALKESERLYRLLADNVQDVIWTTDRDLRPVYISPAITALGGYDPARAMTILYRSIILESPLFEDFRKIPHKTEVPPLHWELEMRKKDGARIWVESIASPLWSSSGVFSGIIGVTRDITSRKSIMIELEAAKEQANHANQAKSEFLANMSHEIRTPMNGVLGTLQLLGLTDLSSEQRELVETALRSGHSLLTIINDILDFSKIEAGKVVIQSERFSPHDLITSLIATFKTITSNPDLLFTYRIDPDVPAIIIADQVRFRQILSNLISNSIKFTEEGHINIRLQLKAKLPKEKIRLSCTVTDTGIGLPDHEELDLFEPFTQIECAFRRKYKGTGLGLSIVRRLVTLMGGSVQITGREGHGTTVTFDIVAGTSPTATSSMPSEITLYQPCTGKKHLHILLVEDELINQQILRSILEKMHHTVTIAHNGRQALQALLKSEYDFVLMDIQMPEMDGYEATRRIRTSKKYQDRANIPIVALTAFAMTGDKEKCLQAGMNGYLSKPVDFKALEQALRQHADC